MEPVKDVLNTPPERVNLPVEAVVAENDIKSYVHQKSVEIGVDPTLVEKIITCESNWNPKALNYNKNGTTDHGLLQVNSIHAKSMAGSILKWEISLIYGLNLLKKEGTIPWTWSKPCWNKPIVGW